MNTKGFGKQYKLTFPEASFADFTNTKPKQGLDMKLLRERKIRYGSFASRLFRDRLDFPLNADNWLLIQAGNLLTNKDVVNILILGVWTKLFDSVELL